MWERSVKMFLKQVSFIRSTLKLQGENTVLNMNIWLPVTLAILGKSIRRSNHYDISIPYFWNLVAIQNAH